MDIFKEQEVDGLDDFTNDEAFSGGFVVSTGEEVETDGEGEDSDSSSDEEFDDS